MTSNVKRISTRAILTLAAFGIATGVSSASAQSAPPQQPPSQQQPPAQGQTFSTGELRTYAAVSQQIQQINQTYQPRVQAAENPQKQQEVQQEAMNKMVQVIQSQGLTVDKYNAITKAAQSNPAVANQIRQHSGGAK